MSRISRQDGERQDRVGVEFEFASDPKVFVIRYFETPLVVDNALQETIEETARA